MNSNKMFQLFLVCLVAYCLIGYIGGVSHEENADAQWGNVQTAYQRRADLIPQLLNTVKGLAAQESRLFTEVAEARAAATRNEFNIDPSVLSQNPELMKKFAAAQGELSNTLTRLLALREDYPDMKSHIGFQNLMVQLEGTENRIQTERRRYNDEVRGLNTFRRIFLSAAMITDARQYFEAYSGSEIAPEVNFD